MRISDWSSDVCSSDLIGRRLAREHRIVAQAPLLRTLDFGVPIRALDEPHRQAPPGRRTEGISPGDHRRGAALVRLHRHAEAIPAGDCRSEEHTSELQSLMRISYAVFCLKKKNKHYKHD